MATLAATTLSRRTPLGEQGDGVAEATPRGRQRVAHAHGVALVRVGGDEGVTLQRLQACRQDVGSDAVDLVGELAERAVTGEQGADDAQAPTVANLLGCAVEGGVVDRHLSSVQ